MSGIHKEENKQSVVSGACTSIVQSEALCERLIAGLTGVQARPMPMPRITDEDNVQMLTRLLCSKKRHWKVIGVKLNAGYILFCFMFCWQLSGN